MNMIYVFIANLIIAGILIWVSLKNKNEKFNLLTSSAVFLTFGIVLMLGSFSLSKDYEIATTLSFVAGLLIIIGIILLIISLVMRVKRYNLLVNVAISLIVGAIVLLYFVRDQNLNLKILVVPELSILLAIILIVVNKKNL